MPNTQIKTEVVIVGGGLVGMAMALSLAQQGIPNVLIESQCPDLSAHPSFDDRTLVVNPASQQFWQKLGVWSTVKSLTTAINHVHVSNQGHLGVVRFNHTELGVEHLAHVIEAKALAKVLWDLVTKQQHITLLAPATLENFTVNSNHVELTVAADESTTIQAQLMVAADGAQSQVRKTLKLDTEIKSYQKTAVICNIQTTEKHDNWAYERLTQHGPMALLPFNDRYGFVWSMPTEQAKQLMTYDDDTFLAQAQHNFGFRKGQFIKLGQRSCYPLYRIQVAKQYAPRVVLIGNAAHSVSPVSAQGLNLAVRGVVRLVSVLSHNKSQEIDLGDVKVLAEYQQASEDDQQRTLSYTDDLMTWFAIDEPLVNGMRSLGLMAIDSNLALKRKIFNTAGGLR